MNSDPRLPFGKEIQRQIKGLVERYPSADGVFVDQLGYSFLDTAHSDGITAVNNRAASLTAFNFDMHLKQLSALLHPDKVIIGNGASSIFHLQYVDALMAESSGWLCDQFQYYSIGSKPIFFLEYDVQPEKIENMFQQCLYYGAGYTSLNTAKPCLDIYNAYAPLLQHLYRRKWVFEPRPLSVPSSYKGSIFRGRKGTVLIPLIKTANRYRESYDRSVEIRIKDLEEIKTVKMHSFNGGQTTLPFHKDNSGVQFDVPSATKVALIECEF